MIKSFLKKYSIFLAVLFIVLIEELSILILPLIGLFVIYMFNGIYWIYPTVVLLFSNKLLKFKSNKYLTIVPVALAFVLHIIFIGMGHIYINIKHASYFNLFPISIILYLSISAVLFLSIFFILYKNINIYLLVFCSLVGLLIWAFALLIFYFLYPYFLYPYFPNPNVLYSEYQFFIFWHLCLALIINIYINRIKKDNLNKAIDLTDNKTRTLLDKYILIISVTSSLVVEYFFRITLQSDIFYLFSIIIFTSYTIIIQFYSKMYSNYRSNAFLTLAAFFIHFSSFMIFSSLKVNITSNASIPIILQVSEAILLLLIFFKLFNRFNLKYLIYVSLLSIFSWFATVFISYLCNVGNHLFFSDYYAFWRLSFAIVLNLYINSLEPNKKVEIPHTNVSN